MLSLELANAISRDRRREVEEALRAKGLREAGEAHRQQERSGAIAVPARRLGAWLPVVAKAR
jgi:hypothetical protein